MRWTSGGERAKKKKERGREEKMEEETDEAETASDADDLSWRGYRYEGEEWRLEAGREQ